MSQITSNDIFFIYLWDQDCAINVVPLLLEGQCRAMAGHWSKSQVDDTGWMTVFPFVVGEHLKSFLSKKRLINQTSSKVHSPWAIRSILSQQQNRIPRLAQAHENATRLINEPFLGQKAFQCVPQQQKRTLSFSLYHPLGSWINDQPRLYIVPPTTKGQRW